MKVFCSRTKSGNAAGQRKTKGPFTPAILAAIFAAISPCKLLAILRRFASPVAYAAKIAAKNRQCKRALRTHLKIISKQLKNVI